MLIDKLLLEHVGLPHVLVLAVHLVNFFGWMSQGGHSEQLFFCTFLPEHSFILKSWGWVGVGGGPCDYCVSPSPKNWVFGFFRLGLNLGLRIWGLLGQGIGDWGLGLGLDNSIMDNFNEGFLY